MIFAGTCFFLDFSFIPDCRSLPMKQGVLNGVFEMATYRHYPSRIMSRGYFAAFAVAAAFAAFTVVNAEPDFNEAGPWQSFPSYTVINDTSIVSAPSFVLIFPSIIFFFSRDGRIAYRSLSRPYGFFSCGAPRGEPHSKAEEQGMRHFTRIAILSGHTHDLFSRARPRQQSKAPCASLGGRVGKQKKKKNSLVPDFAREICLFLPPLLVRYSLCCP